MTFQSGMSAGRMRLVRRPRWPDPRCMVNAASSPALRVLPGLVLSLLVAIAAWPMAERVPFGSPPVLAIVIGLLVGALLGPRPVLRPGLRASSSTLLRGAVVVLGAGLPLTIVLSQGARSLPVIVVTLGGCLLVAATLGRSSGSSTRCAR